jgi:NADH dehydrogenase
MLERTRFVMGCVSAIDPHRKMLTASTLAGELTLPYEHLVLAFGNRARLDLIPGLAENALPLKTIGDAMHIRNMVLRRVAQIELETDPAVRRRLGHFVVIGGGFSGVETAGELADCLKGIRRYYPRVAKDELKVTLLQDQPRLLLELSERLGVAAHRSLAARGVDVRTSTRATCVGPRAVALAGGEMLHAATTICTIGTRPNALVERMTIPVERGRIVVNPDLSVRDTAGLWAIGDCALVTNAHNGGFAPPTAQFAVREARHLAANLLAALLDGRDRPQERCRRHLRHSLVGPASVASMARVLPIADAHARPEGADLRRVDMGHVLPDRHHSSAIHPESRGRRGCRTRGAIRVRTGNAAHGTQGCLRAYRHHPHSISIFQEL